MLLYDIMLILIKNIIILINNIVIYRYIIIYNIVLIDMNGRFILSMCSNNK